MPKSFRKKLVTLGLLTLLAWVGGCGEGDTGRERADRGKKLGAPREPDEHRRPELDMLADFGFNPDRVANDPKRLNRLINLAKYTGPQRDEWQKPGEVIKALRIVPGQSVADVGSASGYFAWHLSRAVGPEGRVLAVDIDPVAIEFMEKRLAADPPAYPNVRIVPSAADDVKIEKESLDLVFLCDAEFFTERSRVSRACLRTLFEAVKPGGRAAVIETMDRIEHGKVSEQTVVEVFEEAGFAKVEVYDLLKFDSHNRTGGQHFVVFRRPGG